MLVTVKDWRVEDREKKKKGKTYKYKVTIFSGIKHGYGNDPDVDWEKEIVHFGRDGEFVNEIKSYGKGAQLLLRHEKVRVAGYSKPIWKIFEIEPWGDTHVKVPNDPEIPSAELELLEQVQMLKDQIAILTGGTSAKEAIEKQSELQEPELPE